jgi:hypothetical protein
LTAATQGRARLRYRRATEADDAVQEALLADAVGPALLVVLETLEPAERLALVLHDVFGVPFDRIVARRQKSHGMHWGAQTCDALAALRTLHLNNAWDKYWVKRQALPLVVAA